MYCGRCGQMNDGHALHCAMCGSVLQGAVYAPPGAVPVDVPNHLVFALLSTFLCCLPIGIVAVVYAAQVDSKLKAGDIAGAQRASRQADILSWISVGSALFIGVLYTVLVVIGAVDPD